MTKQGYYPDETGEQQIKLKPCPFCGSDDLLVHSYEDYKGGERMLMFYVIRCNKCGIAYSNFNDEKNLDYVIRKWNRRYEIQKK